MTTAAIPTVETPPLSAPDEDAEQALIPSPQPIDGPKGSLANPQLMRLPVELEVAIPLRGFRVRNLLTLESGGLVESQWTHGDDVPLGAADVQLAWSEFEVVATRIAVRLTRLV